MKTHRVSPGFIQMLPLLLLAGYALALFAAVRIVETRSETLLVSAKVKSCADYGSAALRNACLGKGGKAPTSCPVGLIVCGVTNSCLSYAACKAAGASQTDEKDEKETKEEKQEKRLLVRITPIAPVLNNKCANKELFPCPCGCFSAAQFNSRGTDKCTVMCGGEGVPVKTPTPTKRLTMTGAPLASITPVLFISPAAPVVNNTCANEELFPCPCGCFSAAQFNSRGTDKCSDMCGGSVPVKTPTPTKRPSGTPFPPRNPLATPISGLSYYSQVNNDDSISEDCPQKTFNEVGCGEVTVANILTHAGVSTTPNQAASQTKGGKCEGTEYNQNITVLTNNGFQADQYPGSFKDLPEVMGPDDSLWLSVTTDKSSKGHHTYIDGYTIVDGQPVYDLRDPYYGTDMKCVADGDRAFACEAYGKSLHISAPLDSDNSGKGTVAILLSPPGN